MRVTSLLAVLVALAVSVASLLTVTIVGYAHAASRPLPAIQCADNVDPHIKNRPVQWRIARGHITSEHYEMFIDKEWIMVSDDAVLPMLSLLWWGGWRCKPVDTR